MTTNGNRNASTCVVEVAAKHGFSDPTGLAVLRQIASLGLCNVREVRVSALYEISGRLSTSQLHSLARDLLADPVTQEYRLDSATPSPAFLVGPHWRIEVWLKPTVTDPAAGSVLKAISDLGLPAPDSVRTGSAYRILGRLNTAQAEKIAHKLLANPLIHRTRIAPV